MRWCKPGLTDILNVYVFYDLKVAQRFMMEETNSVTLRNDNGSEGLETPYSQWNEPNNELAMVREDLLI